MLTYIVADQAGLPSETLSQGREQKVRGCFLKGQVHTKLHADLFAIQRVWGIQEVEFLKVTQFH